jgi:hypothetical protein
MLENPTAVRTLQGTPVPTQALAAHHLQLTIRNTAFISIATSMIDGAAAGWYSCELPLLLDGIAICSSGTEFDVLVVAVVVQNLLRDWKDTILIPVLQQQ